MLLDGAPEPASELELDEAVDPEPEAALELSPEPDHEPELAFELESEYEPLPNVPKLEHMIKFKSEGKLNNRSD